MRLKQVLLISAVLGVFVPFASFILWFELGFGDLWQYYRMHLFQIWPSAPFWMTQVLTDISLGAILNVPFYMAIGAALWAIFGKTRDQIKPS